MTRHQSSVTVISWIPSEAIRGLPNLPFQVGVTHIDEPPPDRLDSVEDLVEERKCEAIILCGAIFKSDISVIRKGCNVRKNIRVVYLPCSRLVTMATSPLTAP